MKGNNAFLQQRKNTLFVALGEAECHLLKICLDKFYPLKLFIFVALLFVV